MTLNAHLHHLLIQLRSRRDPSDHKESEFSVFTAELYRLANKRNQCLLDIGYERGAK